MKEGDKASWKTVNGTRSGALVGKHRLGWIVRLDNGKIVIVHRKSIINYHEG